MSAPSDIKSIAALRDALQNGAITVKKITQHYLDIIEKEDGSLNAVVSVNKDALSQAEALDALPRDQRGRLFGLPILIKDQIETIDMPTSFGSIAAKDYMAEADATVIRRLKSAGAVILGKTTMNDWACGYSSLSSRSGTTKHPIDTSRDPGGSSGGSATAVAAGMALAAIGGDTGGSIRLPSSFCGLVGVRVTPGRISRSGMSPLVLPMDTPGPMCRNVADAAAILDVLVGYDEADDYTSINALAPQSQSQTPFSDAIQRPVLRTRRIGVLRQLFGVHEGISGVMDKTLQKLQQAGTELIDVSISNLERYFTSTWPYALRSRADINAFCASRKGLSHIKLEDLAASRTFHPGILLIDKIKNGPEDPFHEPEFAKFSNELLQFQRTVASVFAEHRLDAIIYPTCQELAPKTQTLLDRAWTHRPNTNLGSQLLFTAISVPVGTAKDDKYPDDPALPVGLEILGVPLSEERIINIAAGVEGVMKSA